MLGWDIAAALPGLRAQAESRMSETVLVGKFKDDSDPVTGKAIHVLVTERYSGKARVRYPSYAVAELSPASQPIAQQDVVVSLPFGSGPVFEGDGILVTASTADEAEALVGRFFTVKGQPVAGQATAYRVPVIEQS